MNPSSLRRNWRFQCLWIGSALAYVGIETADIGYPLALLALTGSPALAGLFGTVQLLASLLAGLPAGTVADRHDRRRILIMAEAVRAGAGASVVLVALVHALTWPHLIVVAAILGGSAPFGGTARILLVRAVVPADQLTAALTQEQVRDSMSQLIGPPLGGVLYGLRQALPFLASALGFTASLVAALIVRVPVREPSDGRSNALSGLRAIWHDPTL
ncbi:MAG TPA: MFS transporter, partial [Pseudonocardiaceae bacterium]